MARKLATIKIVSQILPIEGRDKIVLAIIDGWQVIVKKDEFTAGDKCIYCEIDSVMPERPEFEFLRKKDFRIKTMKMAGVISQGICFPLDILPAGNYEVGQDVTELLGIHQYEPTIDKEPKEDQHVQNKNPLMRFAWYRKFVNRNKPDTEFPNFISKTNEVRVQNIPYIVDDKEPWIATEKCVSGDTGIWTLDGDIKIRDIVNNRREISVLSYNNDTGKVEYQPIIDWHKVEQKGDNDHYKIGVGCKGKGNRPKFIKCTANHKFYTNEGWTEASNLKVGNIIYHRCEKPPYEILAMLLGCCLGDSYIYYKDKAYIAIHFTHGEVQKDYFNYKFKLLGSYAIGYDERVSGYGSKVYTFYTKTDLFIYRFIKEHCFVNGRKTVTKEWCNAMTPISLAFWYMDDGTLTNKESKSLGCRSAFCTNAYSYDEVVLLSNMLQERFGIPNKIGNKDTYKGYVINIGVEGTLKLASLIAPYVCDSMKYKLPKEYDAIPCVFDNYNLDFYNGICETEILSIENLGPKGHGSYMFDITVANNSNYFANGVLVHNCDGQSGTFALIHHKSKWPFIRDKYEYIVCSRNRKLPIKDDSPYWYVSDRYHIKEVLEYLIGDNDWVAIQGECIGPKIQKNKYKVDKPDLYVFNLIYPSGRLGSVEAKAKVTALGMKFVPIINTNYILPDTVNEVLDYAHGKSEIGNTIREGIVFRSQDGQKSFKAVDPLFLIKYNE